MTMPAAPGGPWAPTDQSKLPTIESLFALLADNEHGDISAKDLRDVLDAVLSMTLGKGMAQFNPAQEYKTGQVALINVAADPAAHPPTPAFTLMYLANAPVPAGQPAPGSPGAPAAWVPLGGAASSLVGRTPHALADLDDVGKAAPTAATPYLAFNLTTQLWEPTAAPYWDMSSLRTTDLADWGGQVYPNDGDVPVYEAATGTWQFDSHVAPSNDPAPGQVLGTDASGDPEWVTPAATVTTLADLTDVTLTAPQAGDALQSDGRGKWANASVYTKAQVDALVGAVVSGISHEVSVLEFGVTQPPPAGSELAGETYILGATPVGVWAGHAWELATWDGVAWVFAAPTRGDTHYVEQGVQAGTTQSWNGSAWIALANNLMNFRVVTKSEYDRMASKDPHTLYLIRA